MGFGNFEVKYFLCWSQWLLGIVLATANVVVCVMDETMVPLNFWGRKGNVVKVGKEDGQHVFTENVGDVKGCLTLIATICNDPALQQHLKQILMPKGRKKKDSDEYESTWPKKGMPVQPPNVEIWTDTSGWCSGKHIIRYMKVLRNTIHQHRPGAQIVLAYDCCSAHIQVDVLRYSAKYLGHVMLFPGQLGWLFDILDTKVFNSFKAGMHEDSTHMRMASESGLLSKKQWAEVLYKNIDKHLTQANYVSEFSRHGLASNADHLRDPIKNIFNPSGAEPPRKLLESELHDLMGMKRNIHRLLFTGTRYSHLDALGHPHASASASSSSASSSSAAPPLAYGAPMPFFKKLKLTPKE